MSGTRNIVVVDALSNLGLRPPAPGAVPGCCRPAGPDLDPDGTAGALLADLLVAAFAEV
ncbi:hypothetical protein OH809_07175 [Streptomyces sp. NBC_00873]|uniref:hypothetical protein n=1 Tax=unclassified Streptomyces TaxID=2593676 RepID=UPI003864D3DA|nr:hypothetical protein OH809_07175 [Streptomyces sp. NBC_00873]WTA49115.1 hypothetical protein OH821_36590 [Streptomyces sp. NBC_00842]